MLIINDIDLVKFVKNVYNLSVPVGMGFMHATSEPLTDEEAKRLINTDKRIVVDMDYVKGRQCKMVVFKEPNGDFVIKDEWFDHTESQLKRLLELSKK